MRKNYLPALLLVLPNVMACDQQGPGSASSAPSSTAAPSVVATAPPALDTAAPAAPEDLDLKGLQKLLNCPAEPKGGPCSILAAFGSCTQWSASTPSGDGRWIGRGHRVEGAKITEEFTVFRARRVPQNEIAPGQLPLKISVAELAKTDGAAWEQADRAIKSFSRHDVPPRGNAAVEFLNRKDNWLEGFVLRTSGGQAYSALEGGAYVCQGAHQQLIVVQRAASRGGKADGLYAEVWPSNW
ncbi:MAG TPA: hypothetical protein PK156_10535 [Polyangium sp.]|nr:hypothetical protein [Polyangium sp.]